MSGIRYYLDAHTFIAMIVAQPFLPEYPRVQLVLEAVNDQRFTTQDDVLKHKLLKLSNTMLVQYVDGYTIDIIEILRAFNEGIEIEIMGKRFEGGAWTRCWHLFNFSPL